MNTTEMLAPGLNRLQRYASVAFLAGLVLCVVGWLTNGNYVFHSYLFAYLFWFGVTGGSLGILMLHHVVGGGWGFIIRRPLEAGTRLFPAMLVLFAPMLIGMRYLYIWARPAAVMSDAVLGAKHGYLNPPFFIARTLIYFALLITLAFVLNKWGDAQDTSDDPAISNRLNVVSAGGLVVYVLVCTFAVVDWLMSLTPHYYSSILGFLFVVMQGLSTLALMVFLTAFIAGREPLVQGLPSRYFRDLGNLMLAFVILWAYMSFSQYLLNYSGNSAEEAGFYVRHISGGWGIISLSLIPFHFALPFLVLLSSSVKVNPIKLAKVAAFILFMRFVDLFWWVTPTFERHIGVSWSDFGAPLLLGGIWLWLWARQMRGRTLAPAHDPRLAGHWPQQEVAKHG